jgi:hypothetical protein
VLANGCEVSRSRLATAWASPRRLARTTSGAIAVELSIEIQLLQIGIYAPVEADDRRSEVRSIEAIGGRSLDRREARLDGFDCGEGGRRNFPQVDRVLICRDRLGWRDGGDRGRLNPTGLYARKNCKPREAGRQCGCDARAEQVSNHSRRLPGVPFSGVDPLHDLVCQPGGWLRGR